MSRPQIESRIRDFFATDHRGVVCVYLFGIQSRNTVKARSDVDVAVLLAKDPPSTLEGLCLGLGGEF